MDSTVQFCILCARKCGMNCVFADNFGTKWDKSDFVTKLLTFSSSNSGDGVGWCRLILVSSCVLKTNHKSLIHFAYKECFWHNYCYSLYTMASWTLVSTKIAFDVTIVTLCTPWQFELWQVELWFHFQIYF